MRTQNRKILILAAVMSLALGSRALAVTTAKVSSPRLIEPAELAKLVASPKSSKPLILQVGFHVLFQQAHIPGSEYIGPASKPDGLRRLRARVKVLPRKAFIVIYCGCCPWSQCPNIKPAYAALKAMGFSNVKELRLPHNFGADWVDKGYPVSKGS